ncbi:ribonuclease E inhibitor RraB [bacterium]|nr:MAG: ribonuclease E inhibitor RraB [bacterium]
MIIRNTKPMNPIHPHSGSFLIGQLNRFGSDLDAKHEITFWLYFPSETCAQKASQKAVEAELSADVTASMDGQWLCLIACPHVPDEALIDGVMQFCIKLASDLGGEFDGWESPLYI